MCGRIKQEKGEKDYMETLHWNPHRLFADREGPRYNIPPGSRPLTLHRLGDGTEKAECLFWGYEPAWGKTGPAANARLDKLIANSAFWRGTLEHRVIIPADGYYEWTGERPHRLPWYVYGKNGAPLLFAAVSGWRPGAESDQHHGFSIVTDAAAGVLTEIHPRRPLALAPEDALEWLDPATTPGQAMDILSAARPESAFLWHRVTPAMNNSRYELADASEPI